MKKLSVIVAVILVLGITLNVAMAESLVKAKIDNITLATDKNGNPYARIIVTEQREKNGFTYDKSIPVMAFGDTYAIAKTLKKGDTLHAVCDRRFYQGRESYTILGFAKAKTK